MDVDLNKPYLEGLTYLQKHFVIYYDGNGTQTAKKAGYKGNDNVLAVTARDNLRKPQIIKALKARDNGDGEKKSNIMSAEEIREALSEIARSSEKPADRLKAIDQLARTKGMYQDKLDITGSIQGLSDTQIEARLLQAVVMIGGDKQLATKLLGQGQPET